MRNLTDSEVLTLQAAGCSAENWQSVYIAENLDVSNIEHCRFEGRVEIEEGVTLRGSTIGNYHICQGAKVIDSVIQPGAVIREGATVTRCIVADDIEVPAGATFGSKNSKEIKLVAGQESE